MKIIDKVIGTTEYPVGVYIMRNLPIIDSMSKALIKLLKTEKILPETEIHLCCMGSSGACISTYISINLLKKGYSQVVINHFKKEGEDSHSSNSPYTARHGISIYVDDFISSGRTIRTLHKYNGSKRPFCIVLSGLVCKEDMSEIDPEYLICKRCK